jgi:hypothetical protein
MALAALAVAVTDQTAPTMAKTPSQTLVAVAVAPAYQTLDLDSRHAQPQGEALLATFRFASKA